MKKPKPAPRKKALKPDAHIMVVDRAFYDSAIQKAKEIGMAEGLELATHMIRAVSPYAHMGLISEITAVATELKIKWGVLS